MFKHKSLFFIILLFLAAGIALGAFGAHELKKTLSAHDLANWQTGVNYHLWSSLGAGLILLLGEREGASALFARAAALMLAGVTLFAGTMYVYTLTHIKGIVYLIPTGGILMIAAYLFAAILVLRSGKREA